MCITKVRFSEGSLPGPPAPIKPLPGALERAATEDDEAPFELEESTSAFLRSAVEPEDDYQTLEHIKTAVHPPHSRTHFAYNRVPWSLKVRKELFSPSETVNSPLAVNLIFCQVCYI